MVQIPALILGRYFFIFISLQKMFFLKQENQWKRGQWWSIFKYHFMLEKTILPSCKRRPQYSCSLENNFSRRNTFLQYICQDVKNTKVIQTVAAKWKYNFIKKSFGIVFFCFLITFRHPHKQCFVDIGNTTLIFLLSAYSLFSIHFRLFNTVDQFVNKCSI